MMIHFFKRSMLSILLLCFVLCLTNETLGAAPDSVVKVRIALLWHDQSEFAGYYMAIQKGFYARRGLDVELLPYQTFTLEKLKSGDAEFATAFLSSGLAYHAEHLRLRLLAQYVRHSTFIIAAWKNNTRAGAGPITNIQDLNGKRISGLSHEYSDPFRIFFELHKIHPAQIYPQYAAPSLFLHHFVDACLVTEYNGLNYLYQRGVTPDELTLFPLKDYKVDFPEDALFCTDSYYARHSDVAANVVQATNEGWVYAKHHPEETLKVVNDIVFKRGIITNPAHVKYMLKHMLNTIFDGVSDNAIGRISEKYFNSTQMYLRQYRILKKEIPYDDIVSIHALDLQPAKGKDAQ